MTQEQKYLLLKDLCARLPYGVKGLVTFNGNPSMLQIQEDRTIDGKLYDRFAKFQDSWYDNVTIKPYLFPLSSMTEEQKQYLKNRFCYDWNGESYDLWICQIEIGDVDELIDWFHKNHIDHRCLIEESLALDATGLGIY